MSITPSGTNPSPTNNQTPTTPNTNAQQKKPLAKQVRQVGFAIAEGTIVVLKLVEQVNDPYGASKVATVVRIFLETVVLARANAKQLGYLSQRVAAVTPVLKRISDTKDTKLQVEPALAFFSNVVNDCTAQAKKYTQKNYVLKLLQTGSNQSQFATLNIQLTDAIGGLTLALGTEATVMLEKYNEQELKKAQEEDQKEIIENGAEISKEVKSVLRLKQPATNTNNQNLTDQDRNDVLDSQVQSAMVTLAGKLTLNPTEKNNFLKTDYQQKPAIDPRLLILFHEIKIQQKIAQGSFGSIYQGFWCEIPVVVKKCGQYRKKEDYEQFVREVQIMSQLRNPYITQFWGACLEPDSCIVMEYMEQGSLDKLLQKRTFTHEKQKSLASDIAKGLLYLHIKEVLHRDLKTANILVNDQDQAKLTDFGLSKTAEQGVLSALDTSDAIQWMAPETFPKAFSVKGSYTTASDIYSYGMVLWSLCTNKKPYENLSIDETIQRIKQGNHETIKSDIPLEFQNIIKGCWSHSVTDRPELTDIIDDLKNMKIEKHVSPDEHYEQGREFLRNNNSASAENSFLLASKQGNIPAKTKLGSMYLQSGKKEQAYQLLLEAAEAHDKTAQFNLARMLEKGDGVTKNLTQALRWYKAAQQQGVSEATAKIELLEKLTK
jgi:tRNA A-37 threonylcarbamoyl transferase component Bud32